MAGEDMTSALRVRLLMLALLVCHWAHLEVVERGENVMRGIGTCTYEQQRARRLLAGAAA